MEDQIGAVLHWSHQKEPKQAKRKDEVIRTWIGFAFQLLLPDPYPQTHPGIAK